MDRRKSLTVLFSKVAIAFTLLGFLDEFMVPGFTQRITRLSIPALRFAERILEPDGGGQSPAAKAAAFQKSQNSVSPQRRARKLEKSALALPLRSLILYSKSD